MNPIHLIQLYTELHPIMVTTCASIQIAAEMYPYDPNRFWLADRSVQAEVIKAFAGTDAKAIVAEYVPSDHPTIGWQRVGLTTFVTYILPS